MRVRKRWSAATRRSSYRYSAESDYWSHGIGGVVRHAALGRHGDGQAVARAQLRHDVARKGRTPDCRPGMPAEFCTLNIWFAGVSYTQVLSPVALAQVSYETAYLDGFQGNLYRMVSSLMRYEYLPEHADAQRDHAAHRVLLAADRDRVPAALPLLLGLLPGRARRRRPIRGALIAHTIEARVYQQLTPTVEMRLLLRYYRQNHAQLLVRRAPAVSAAHGVLRGRTDPPPATGRRATTRPIRSSARSPPVPGGEDRVGRGRAARRAVPALVRRRQPSRSRTATTSRTPAFGDAHLLQTGYRLPY